MTGEARTYAASADGPTVDRPTVDGERPWPGLAAFREEDQSFFRGRRAEAEALHLRVKLERLTVVFGKSGLGKTSLLLAGLFPRLRREDVLPVYLRLDYSAGAPDLRDQVQEAILRAAEAAEVEAPAARESETLWEYFHRQNADFWSRRNRPVVPLLAFDQFEEIFTLGKERADAGALIDALGELIEGHPPPAVKARLDADPKAAREFSFGRHDYKVLLALREDFLPDLEGLRGRIRSIVQNRLRLAPMSGDAAFEVVTGPRELITDEVAERVIRFVAAAKEEATPRRELVVEPALLSVVCRELNARRLARGEPRITAADLERDQAEILDDFYQRNLSDVTPQMRGFVEEKLVTADGYRNTVALDDALKREEINRDEVKLLVDRRLLRIEPRRRLHWLELTHDLLTGVVVASRDARRRREAEKRAEAARREAEERELKARDELRRARFTTAILLMLLAVAGAAVFWAIRERDKAERNERAAEELRRAAFARQLTAQAEAALARPGPTLELGTLLAIESLRRRPAVEADEALRAALTGLPLRLNEARLPWAEDAEVRALAPGGELLIAAVGGRVAVVDAASGEVRSRLPLRPEHARLAAFSRDGRTLALGGAERVTVWRDWDSTGATRIAAIDVEKEYSPPAPSALALSSDGRHLAVGNLQTVTTWEVGSETPLASLEHPHPTGMIHCVVQGLDFSPDGQRLASANGSSLRPYLGTLKIWEGWRSGDAREVADVEIELSIWRVTFGPDGRHLVTDGDAGIDVLDIATFERRSRHEHSGRGAPRGARHAISPDGKRLATAGDQAYHVWENWWTADLREVARMVHPDGREPVAVTFSRDSGRLITLRRAPGALIRSVWEPRGYRQAAKMTAPGGFDRVAVSPDGEYLATVSNGAGQVWSLPDGRPVGEPIDAAGDVAFSPDGELLATATREGVRLWRAWRTAAREEVANLAYEESGWFLRVAFGAGGELLVSGTEKPGNMRVLRLAGGEQILSRPASRHALDASGRYLALSLRRESGQTQLEVWDLERGPEQSFGPWSTDASIRALALGRGGTLAFADGVTVRLLSLPGGAEAATLKEDWPVSALAFSPDGGSLAIAGGEPGSPFSDARIWDLATRRPVASVRHVDADVEAGLPTAGRPPLNVAINDVAFSPDGRHLVTASADGTARVWLWRSDDLIAEACRRLGRNLSTEEWNRYLGEAEPYRETCPESR